MRISDWSSDVCSSDLLRTDDETELVTIALCRFEPSFTVHRVAVGAIELPTSALARRTVALHIAQMRLGALEAVSAQFDGANLDAGAALTKGGEAVTRCQDATDAGAASDAADGNRRLPGAPGCAAALAMGGGGAPRRDVAWEGLLHLCAKRA